MVAHNAPFDRRVLRQAFDRIGLDWPDPPVLCTAALARALLPLQPERGLGVLADALGIEVELAHRALADAETCARVLCALFPRLCANAATVAEALALLKPRRAEPAQAAGGRVRYATSHADPSRRRSTSPSCPETRGSTSSATTADGSLYVGKSVSIRSRARAHFAPSSPPAAVDAARDRRRLPHDRVRARRARAGEPPDQGAQAARQHAPDPLRRPARVHPLPARHPVPDPRGRPGSGGRTRGHDRPAARAPARRRAGRAARLAVRAASLRTPAAAPRASLGLRADGPLPVAVPGRP